MSFWRKGPEVVYQYTKRNGDKRGGRKQLNKGCTTHHGVYNPPRVVQLNTTPTTMGEYYQRLEKDTPVNTTESRKTKRGGTVRL